VISILIPIFNYDIRSLVVRLQHQAEKALVPYEIICLDDCSDFEIFRLNDEIKKLRHVKHSRLSENVGRSAIRNRLAEMANFDYLLFMDCDTMPETEIFVFNYVANLKENTVLYGGRSYSPEKPFDKSLYFHWYYGSKREVKSLVQRKEFPHRSFMTNNFVIPKALILEIRFDENLKQYGHEDTLFGLELKKKGVDILHLDNPLRHVGLEPAEQFLKKSEQAVENLLIIMQQHQLEEDIKLLRYFVKTKKWGLHPFIDIWFYFNKKRLLKNLLGYKPCLRKFDLYKLGYMVKKRKLNSNSDQA
jgi:glycosyltransferase involved in cell wall biosynthesis